MNRTTRLIALSLITTAAGIFAIAQVSPQLFVFRPGTPIRADEVNANFQLLNERVEDARAQLAAVTTEVAELEEQLANFQGIPGPQGEAGPMGPAGERGPQGEAGEQGAAGVPGQAGVPGPTGPEGPRGAQGAQGVPGPPGETGSSGERGARGEQGLPGPQGERGEPGTSFSFQDIRMSVGVHLGAEPLLISCESDEALLSVKYAVEPDAALRNAIEAGLRDPGNLPSSFEYITGERYTAPNAVEASIMIDSVGAEPFSGLLEVHWTALCAPVQTGR